MEESRSARIRLAGAEDAEAIARVRVETWRAAYAGIVPADFLASLSVETDTPRWRQRIEEGPQSGSFVLVAEVDGEVVGFASSGPERSGDPIFQGEIYALYVRPAYQRRGIGRRLVGAAARRLQQAGISGLLIRVLADNPPARRFYEQLGGQLVRAGEIEIGGARLAQVGYGWLDLQGLAAMSDL